MEHFYISTEHSPWLIPLCIAGGALYAFVLYSKKPAWSGNINKLLAGLRFVLASVLLFLLLAPFIRYISNNARKPVVAVTLDTSQSVKLFSDSVALSNTLAGIERIRTSLQEKEVEVAFHTLSGKTTDLQSPKFDAPNTNLDLALTNLQSDYENRNLAAVVMLSDGLYNQGRSPLYSTVSFPVYAVGLGDTTQKRDVLLSGLLYNKVSYSGNNLPMVAEVRQTGFGAKQVTVTLAQGNKVLERKQVTLPANGATVKVPFTVTAGKPGKLHYTVVSEVVSGEFTELNNTAHAYIDVIEGRLKVLLAAAAPHPDIKALKQALEAEDNIEVITWLSGIDQFKPADYDLAILHQIPAVHRGGAEALEFVATRRIPALYIVGLQTDIQAFNQLATGVTIRQRSAGQTDQVTPVYNPSFNKFTYATELQQQLRDYPPVEVPFADFTLSPGMEVVLKQQVGNVPTDKPLLALKSGSAGRSGVLIGDGIWEWRLRQFAKTDNADSFDKLFRNVVQLLTVKESKKKLNVYPVKDEFSETEPVQFQAEVYNNVYQRIFGNRISLSITGEDNQSRNFSFINGENNPPFTVGNLSEGLYRYTAKAELNGKTETAQGEFIVQAHQVEALRSEADHGLLYQLAKQTGGNFYLPAQLTALENELLKQNFKPVLFATEKLQDLINFKWVFFVLLALLSLEWFLRKFFGGY